MIDAKQPIVVENPPGDEGKFWIESLHAKYFRYSVDADQLGDGCALILRDQRGAELRCSVLGGQRKKGEQIRIEVALLPIGSTDWTKAERVNVIIKESRLDSSSTSTSELNNPLLAGGVSQEGHLSDLSKTPIKLFEMQSWTQIQGSGGVSTASKPARSLTLVLDNSKDAMAKSAFGNRRSRPRS